MIVKKFDYKEFISKSKSLNCDNVGATGATGIDDATDSTGVTGVTGATGATGINSDIYNGDNKTINLEHDKTTIVPKEVTLPKTKEGKKKELSKSTMMILGVVMGVAALGAAYYIYKKIKQDKEQKNGRKRLLLLSK